MRGIWGVGLLCTALAGCGTDVYDRPGTTQASYNVDIARCQMYAEGIPMQHTPQQPVYDGSSMTTVTGTANTYGNTTMVNGMAVTRPVPNQSAAYANAGAALGDAISNAVRKRNAVRLCMQSLGYSRQAK